MFFYDRTGLLKRSGARRKDNQKNESVFLKQSKNESVFEKTFKKILFFKKNKHIIK